jgi:hypothetical protein
MEKNKQIFDVNLNSLLDTPIEVDGTSTNYMEDVIPSKDDVGKDKEVNEPEDDGMIDLETDQDSDNEDNETEEEEDTEDTSEDPSSAQSSPPKGNKSKSSSPLTPYAQLLVDEGVLPNLDIKQFDGSAEGLKEAMINEILNGVDMYKASLPNRLKSLINNYEEGVPFEKLLDLDKSEVTLEKITEDTLEDDVTTQKQVVIDYLKRTTKFTEKKINSMVERMEDSGELEDEAKSSLGELKDLLSKEKEEEKKNMQAQQKMIEENRRREIATLHEKIRSTQEVVPGIKVNDKVRQAVLTSMTQPVGYDQNGNPVNRIVAARMENPMEFELKLHYLFEITKGFTDFTKLAEKGRKDASKSFEDAVNELDRSTDGGVESKTNLGPQSKSFLKGLEKTFKL